MAQQTVTTTPVQLPPGGTITRIVIQNKGPGRLAVGPDPDVSMSNAVVLESGGDLDFSKSPELAYGLWDFWVVSDSSADVRYMVL